MTILFFGRNVIVAESMFRFSTELEMTFSNFQRSIAMHRLHRFEVLTFYRIKHNILEYNVSAKNHIPREYVNGDFHLFSLSIFRLSVHSELFQETPVAVDRKVGLNCIHLVC